MSDTKFTPGPWWAAIGKDQPVPYYRGLVAVLSSDPYISICTGETGDQSGRTCGGDEWEANAALIAAAPQMCLAAARDERWLAVILISACRGVRSPSRRSM